MSMTNPDYRALCAELLTAIQLYTKLNPAASEMSAFELTEKLMDAMAATNAALAQPEPESAAVQLAARPLLEKVARMADCIDQRTVGEIIAISDQAAAWLEANPPVQPIAIEPRGCPTPGACSCIEPVAPTTAELMQLSAACNSRAVLARAVLARYARPAIQPVPVSERPWEREGWLDAEGRCWWFNHAGIPEWQLASDGPYGDFSLPHHALPVPTSANTISQDGH